MMKGTGSIVDIGILSESRQYAAAVNCCVVTQYQWLLNNVRTVSLLTLESLGVSLLSYSMY